MPVFASFPTTTEGNYNDVRGNSRGEKKKGIAYKLTIEMNKISRCNRTGKAVLGKIQYIEEIWKRAHDWINQTGKGIKEDDPANFEEALLKYCQLYYTLLDVMYSRSLSKALATTDDLLYGDDDVSECGEISSIRSTGSGADFVEVRIEGKISEW